MICECVSEHTIQCNVQCVLYSPNSITVVSASFRWASSDFPRWYSHFGEPPNLVTWIRPGHIIQAVRVWPKHGRVPSGRVSWGEGRQLTDSSIHAKCCEHTIIVYVYICIYRTWPDMAEPYKLKSLRSSLTYLNTQTWIRFTEVIFSFLLTLRTNLCHFAYSTNQKIIQITENQSKNMITDQYVQTHLKIN